MTNATEDISQNTDDITEGALSILQHLLDKAYEQNARLGNQLTDERAKVHKAQYAEQEAKRRYNELVALLRFNYPEDD